MAHVLGPHNAFEQASRCWLKGPPPSLEFDKFRRRPEVRRQGKILAIEPEQRAELGLADARRVFQHSLEYWLQFAGRAADDLKHVSSRGLLLEGLAQFVRQAAIFDRDDGLRGEVFDQLDVLVGETPHLLAVDDDGADQIILLEHRYDEQRASAAYVDDGNGHRGAFEVRRQGPSVADVDDLLRPDDLGMGSPRMGAE